MNDAEDIARKSCKPQEGYDQDLSTMPELAQWVVESDKIVSF